MCVMYVMYVCTYVCMHACMQVCMYVCMHACMHVYMSGKYMCTYVHLHICMSACRPASSFKLVLLLPNLFRDQRLGLVVSSGQLEPQHTSKSYQYVDCPENMRLCEPRDDIGRIVVKAIRLYSPLQG